MQEIDTEFSRFISTSLWLSKCTLTATVSTQALSVLRGSSRYPLCIYAQGRNATLADAPPPLWGHREALGLVRHHLSFLRPPRDQHPVPAADGSRRATAAGTDRVCGQAPGSLGCLPDPSTAGG